MFIKVISVSRDGQTTIERWMNEHSIQTMTPNTFVHPKTQENIPCMFLKTDVEGEFYLLLGSPVEIKTAAEFYEQRVKNRKSMNGKNVMLS